VSAQRLFWPLWLYGRTRDHGGLRPEQLTPATCPWHLIPATWDLQFDAPNGIRPCVSASSVAPHDCLGRRMRFLKYTQMGLYSGGRSRGPLPWVGDAKSDRKPYRVESGESRRACHRKGGLRPDPVCERGNGDQGLEISDRGSEIRDARSETKAGYAPTRFEGEGNCRATPRGLRSEIRDQRSRIRDQRCEIRDQGGLRPDPVCGRGQLRGYAPRTEVRH
jgi:hypothetical protein